MLYDGKTSHSRSKTRFQTHALEIHTEKPFRVFPLQAAVCSDCVVELALSYEMGLPERKGDFLTLIIRASLSSSEVNFAFCPWELPRSTPRSNSCTNAPSAIVFPCLPDLVYEGIGPPELPNPLKNMLCVSLLEFTTFCPHRRCWDRKEGKDLNFSQPEAGMFNLIQMWEYHAKAAPRLDCHWEPNVGCHLASLNLEWFSEVVSLFFNNLHLFHFFSLHNSQLALLDFNDLINSKGKLLLLPFLPHPSQPRKGSDFYCVYFGRGRPNFCHPCVGVFI